MPVDHTLILDVPTAMNEAVARSREAGRPLKLARPPPLLVALVGPRAGKTTILRALHGGPVHDDGLMPEWHARLVEYPSLERAADLRTEPFDRLWRDPVGILYVLPSRGPSDEDEQALEMLSSRSVVTLENIHDSELHPARASITLLGRPEIGCPFAVPIAPLMQRYSPTKMPPAERLLLRNCVAFLQSATLAVGNLDTVYQQAKTARQKLRTDIDGQWRRALALATEPALTGRLDALRRLLILRDDCAVSAAFDAGLTELIRLLELSGSTSSHLSLSRLRKHAQDAADRYNIEAGCRPSPGAANLATSTTVPGAGPQGADGEDVQIGFGRDYVQGRQQLRGFLGNMLAQRSRLTLTKEEQASLELLLRKVDADNIDIALLGRFSSGKSSLINALLGVAIDDKRPTLLPTGVRPETATVNWIRYSADGGIEVEWLKRARLTFAAETSDPGQLRLHVEEIKTFHTWLSSRQITLRDVTFTELPDRFRDLGHGSRMERSAQHAAFRRVWEDLGFPDAPKKFAYARDVPASPTLTDSRFPASAVIDPLPAAGALWPAGASRAETFAAVKGSVSLALLIDRLHIGYDHPLLKHASFIDTPGTDAPIPHHRRVAQGIIRERNCPVIYCFLGERPGGIEDRDNLKILQEWGIGRTDLNRFFFVITMKARIAEDEREAVREHVRRCLHEIGITDPALYFVDVVHYPDDSEFQVLKDAVEQFIRQSRAGLFGSWLDQARAIVSAARCRCASELDALQESETQRRNRVTRLNRDLASLAALAEEFENSPRWGAPWARHRVDTVTCAKADQVTQVIEELKSRKLFAEVRERLEDTLNELNRSTGSTINAAHNGMLAKLRVELAGIRPGEQITVSEPTIAEHPFPSTEVLEATSDLSWRGIFKRTWQRVVGSEEFRADAGNNRERIAEPWQESRSRGTNRATSLIEESIEDARTELNRISASVKAELDVLSAEPSPEDQDKLKRAGALAGEWLSRLDALGRQAG
jgi:hypothetical protein